MQQVWKWQPEGGRIGLGTSPCSMMRMDEPTRKRHAGFERVQADLMRLLDALCALYTR